MQHKNLNDHLAPPKMLPRTPVLGYKMEYRFDKKSAFSTLTTICTVFNRDGKNAIAVKAANEVCAVYGENINK